MKIEQKCKKLIQPANLFYEQWYILLYTEKFYVTQREIWARLDANNADVLEMKDEDSIR